LPPIEMTLVIEEVLAVVPPTLQELLTE